VEVEMARSTVFKTNRTQAVRIPKELAFPDEVREVEVRRNGNTLVITPAYKDWRDWFENAPRLSDDFPEEIEELPADRREAL
jgi:antitoxin VapB